MPTLYKQNIEIPSDAAHPSVQALQKEKFLDHFQAIPRP